MYLAFLSFTYRKSASCTHVSAVLHALSGLQPAFFSLKPNLPPASIEDDDISVTSRPCQWKHPKKRKESTLRIAEATFVKHDYSKPTKRKVASVEEFDPRPPEFRGTASQRLPELLQELKHEHLCISLLYDPECRQDALEEAQQPASYNVPNIADLTDAMAAFKETLKISRDVAREIEKSTQQQRLSTKWYSVRKYRITASLFGAILSRRLTTPPDSLVLRIIQPKCFSTPATAYGIEHEMPALQAYTTHQLMNGHSNMVVTASGFHINPDYPFLGASPDGSVYDPSSPQQPFGFVEIKCPYSFRDLSPVEACARAGFYCDLDVNGKLKLKATHAYYAQVQGQMALGERPWCDFVVFTRKGINIERIYFNRSFWKDKLLPKLTNFYDNCVVPEIVSPVHHIGLPMRDLSKH